MMTQKMDELGIHRERLFGTANTLHSFLEGRDEVLAKKFKAGEFRNPTDKTQIGLLVKHYLESCGGSAGEILYGAQLILSASKYGIPYGMMEYTGGKQGA